MLRPIRTFLLPFIACLHFSVCSSGAWAYEYPPSVANDPKLMNKLENAYRNKGPNYSPRTHLKENGQPKYINRLIEAVSPYLLQHAHNPVDWRAWSLDVLQEAKSENKLIFLSVGYATCHWCHVMERESFDQEDVADVLNEHFVSIKIDREEHPDLDHLYLTATQLQQGQAGWPNTLWLTPDGKPFHTATYLTKEEFTRTSLILAEGWRSPSARKEILEVANGLSGQVRQIVGGGKGSSVPLNDVIYSRATTALLEKHNEFEGGFSETNQFPQEPYLLFLLDQWRRGGKDELLDAVTVTLDAIVAGGIHDHVGGGFHRYAVDPGWRTPHFEKMLYNQAFLSRVLIETWEATGKPTYARAAKRTIEYVMRDMRADNGAFYAAEDADSLNSDGQVEEGAFYTWQADNLISAFDGNLQMASRLVGGSSSFGTDPLVLHLDVEREHQFAELDPHLERLRIMRTSRPKPFKDTKLIAGWNGLMIRSMVIAGTAFDEGAYIASAERAAKAVWNNLWKDRQLARFLVADKSNGDGLLEDYVWLALGFVSLWDATGDDEWLARAKLLTSTAIEKFSTENGRLKQASVNGPLGPVFGAMDDAVPAAESSMLELLGMLIHRTGDLRYYSLADRIASGLSIVIARKPEELSYALLANRIPIEGESANRQIRGNGNVKLHLKEDRLILDIRDGWHLSAHAPGYDYLIGTNIKGAEADWPIGTKKKLGFATKDAFVYEGKLEIPTHAEEEKLSVTVQACSNQICLAPEKAVFRISLKK